MAGATATALELAISGTVPLGTVLPAMLGTHALIGAGEAVITVAAVSAVLSTRPDLRRRAVSPPRRMKLFTILALALADRARHRRLAVRLQPPRRARAGRRPTRPSSTTGESAAAAPITDYAFPGIENERVATGLAGFAGTLIVFGLGLRDRRRTRAAPHAHERPPRVRRRR